MIVLRVRAQDQATTDSLPGSDNEIASRLLDVVLSDRVRAAMIFGAGTTWVPPSMTQLLTDHADAVGDFVARAAVISPDHWNVERANGKWSPAQEAKHLALGYEAFVRDL